MAQNIRAAKALEDEVTLLAKNISELGIATGEVSSDAAGESGTVCAFDATPVEGSLTVSIYVAVDDEGKKGDARFGATVKLAGLDGTVRVYAKRFADKKQAAAFVEGALAVAGANPVRFE